MILSKAPRLGRRQFLGAAAGLAGSTLLSSQPIWASTRTVFKFGTLEALVMSDGHFALPTGFLVDPDAPPAARETALKSAGHGGDQIQLVNNVVMIRSPSAVILVDAGAGPRHQPTAGKLIDNLKAAGIEPTTVTQVVLTHGHPDHLWGILDVNNNLLYPNASYVVSAAEWSVWSDPDVMRKLPTVLANDRIVNGARRHFSRIQEMIRMVRHGDEIISGVRVIDTPGHTPGHMAVELAGENGLLIAGDALTHEVISFQHPSWRVTVDHEPDRGISTRLRLLDRLATDKHRLLGAHLPFPGTGFVERAHGSYRFVAA